MKVEMPRCDISTFLGSQIRLFNPCVYFAQREQTVSA